MHTSAQCLRDSSRYGVSSTISSCSSSSSSVRSGEIIGHQTVYMLLQRTDCFHQSSFKVIADTHNLSGCFHLSRQSSLCTDKLIKWKTRNLYNTVIQHWLETCIGLPGDCILDLIQMYIQERSLPQPWRSDIRLPWKPVRKNGLHEDLPR